MYASSSQSFGLARCLRLLHPSGLRCSVLLWRRVVGEPVGGRFELSCLQVGGVKTARSPDPQQRGWTIGDSTPNRNWRVLG